MRFDAALAGPRVERSFEEAGLSCFTKTNPLGFRTGYVALPAGHALYGKGCAEAHDALPGLDVNGDLTYAGGLGGFWLYGWDAGHLWNAPDPDIMDPGHRALRDGLPAPHAWGEPGAHMVDADEAEATTRLLARRLAGPR